MRVSLIQLFFFSLLIFVYFWINPKYLIYTTRFFKKLKKRSK